MKSAKGIVLLIAVALAAAAVYFGFFRQIAPNASKPANADTEISLRLTSFALNLDPLTMSDTESRRVATLLHLGLVRVDHDGKVLAGVAKEWRREGMQYIFSLKQGSTFSDGSPITPDDVKSSLCRAMQPTAIFSWALASIQHVKTSDGKSIECTGITTNTDAKEVSLVETTAKPWLLEALAGPAGWITKPKATDIKYGDVVGAGPYKAAEVVPDSRVVLIARQGGPLQPKTARVVFRLVADDAQAVAALKSGQLDVIDVSSPALAKMLGLADGAPLQGFTLQEAPSDRMRVLILGRKNLAAKGFSDAQVGTLKSALATEFDAAKLTQSGMKLAARASVPFPFSQIPAEPPPQVSQALPNAKLQVISESDQYSDFVASLIPKAVGNTKIDYRGIDKGLLINQIVKGDFDIASVAIEGTIKAPEFWISFFVPGSPFAAFGMELESLRGRALNDDESRSSSLREIAVKGNWIGLVQEQKVLLIRKPISGVRLTPTGQTSYEAIER